jgi:hypothetical protein
MSGSYVEALGTRRFFTEPVQAIHIRFLPAIQSALTTKATAAMSSGCGSERAAAGATPVAGVEKLMVPIFVTTDGADRMSSRSC